MLGDFVGRFVIVVVVVVVVIVEFALTVDEILRLVLSTRFDSFDTDERRRASSAFPLDVVI